MKRINIFLIMLFILFSSCKKETTKIEEGTGPLSVEFDHVVGNADLSLGAGSYTNSSGENFSVDIFRYYVSNFIFTKTDGTVYTVPQSDCYFLVDESDEETHEPLFELPTGSYKSVQFTIGVDSTRSTMDIEDRTGVLDPTAVAGDMYWGWNSGYIFLKLEGKSVASSLDGDFMYHIGGFGGYSSSTINNIQTVILNLQDRGVPEVKIDGSTNIHLFVDILKLFEGDETVSIAAHPMEMFTPYSTTISANYKSMFSHDHTENE